MLTNDGHLAEKMMHPRHKMKKVYNVVLDRPVTPEDLDRIRQGLELEDGLAPVNWAEYPNPKKKDQVALEIQIGRLSQATGLGRHTTSTTSLYQLPQGGELIDSPGWSSTSVAMRMVAGPAGRGPNVSTAVSRSTPSSATSLSVETRRAL